MNRETKEEAATRSRQVGVNWGLIRRRKEIRGIEEGTDGQRWPREWGNGGECGRSKGGGDSQ